MRTPHPIPYQGSKRNLAPKILSFIPSDIQTLFEPFAGSAAVSIAAALRKKSKLFHLNDINKPLMDLWELIIKKPEVIVKQYAKLWHDQKGNEREFYDRVREKFNKTRRPDFLLYLLARCVKAAIRYNFDGEFNQSPDNRRLGRHPSLMKQDILAASYLLKNRSTLTCQDYREVLSRAKKHDLIYMDPPYQGTFASGGFRYFKDLEFETFVSSLYDLTSRDIPFILSYDGRTEDKTFGKPLPQDLGLKKIEIKAGRSSQATLLGRNHFTYESLYLSKALIVKLRIDSKEITDHKSIQQTEMFSSY
ncbi:MAG: DNA adenine methylase [Bacteroidetes bacterium]|nr:DNA adenine methylase [Bacteroidota bacterium]MCL5737758.1 DNA adenine methylase [Bacteroidota bacterium]